MEIYTEPVKMTRLKATMYCPSFICLMILLFAGPGCQSVPPGMQVGEITLEGAIDPIGIGTPKPHFGWMLSAEGQDRYQTAYQVLVASSVENLGRDEGDLWDSGKVQDDRSQLVPYDGKPLETMRMYFWKVRVWDESSEPSDWSATGTWRMGVLSEDDWAGEWISSLPHEVTTERGFFGTYGQKGAKNPGDTTSQLIRTETKLDGEVAAATVFLVGLGYHELYLNGKKAGTHVLDPLFSDYQKSIYYTTLDVTGLVREGVNAIGVRLGNGFYNLPTQDLFMLDQSHWKTPNKLLFQMLVEYGDGRQQLVTSGKEWKWTESEILWNCIRGGETIDMRKYQAGWAMPGFDDSEWKDVVRVPAPLGKLRPIRMPPLRVTNRIEPVRIMEPAEGTYLVDFGENLTGWVSLRIPECRPGQVVRLFYNEVLNDDGTLNKDYSRSHTKGRFQEGRCICSGNANLDVFEPRFTYHGFRYVQIEGLDRAPAPDEITALSVHTDLENGGYFSCSNQRLNELQSAIRRTLLNSVHSMPGEEPTREKMGWTFDAGMVTMQSYLYNFDAVSTYRKYLQDLIDGQEPNGHVPPIVPTNGWGFVQPDGKPILYDDPWWGSTLLYVAQTLFTWTNDTSILSKAWDPIVSYHAFVASTADDSLFVYWSLGDWLDLKQWTKGWGPGLTPIVQTSTACFFWMSDQLSRMALILGKEVEADRYRELAGRIKLHFNDRFLDRSTCLYAGDSSQTAQAVPLVYGLVPEGREACVYERLKDAIHMNGGHINTGFVGVQPLLKYLSENNGTELVYEVISKEESPGWLHFVVDSFSTVGENLNKDGYGTGHHPFATCVGHWFYQYLCGIRAGSRYPGWQSFELTPIVPSDLQWAKASVETPYGEIRSEWEKESDFLSWQVSIPVNTNATISLPDQWNGELKMNGRQINDKQELRLGSGQYELLLSSYAGSSERKK